LAQHHVENPREIIQPGDEVRVKILEIDSERRRLSLSIKRVEGQELPVRPIQPADLDDVPELGLSEDVFATADAPAEPTVAPADEAPAPEAEAAPQDAAPPVEEALAQDAAPAPDAAPESDVAPEPEATPAPEAEAAPESDAEAAREDESA
jgi:small subunit ribosomal protein S1